MGDLYRKFRGFLGTVWQFGKNGVQLKANSTDVIDLRNSDDTGFARMKGAVGTEDDDFITFKQFKTTQGIVRVQDQADTSTAIPNNTGTPRILVVTTAGNGAVIGDLLYDDGSATGQMQILTAVEGLSIAISDALTGGTISFEADSIYLWDEDNTEWDKIGDIGGVTGAIRLIKFAIDNSASQSSTSDIPANAEVIDSRVKVTVAYSAGATIEVGYTGNTTALQDTDANNPQLIATYGCEDEVTWDSVDRPVLVTVGNTPAVGDGFVYVLYSLPNA